MFNLKQLNPYAQEWRPSPPPPPPPPLPHLIFYHPLTPPPPPSQAPPHKFWPPHTHVLRKGTRRSIPPRMRKPAFAHNKPPPQKKKMWIPKEPIPASNISDDRRSATLSPPPSSFTTVMIKNIPNKLRRDHMLAFLDKYCRIHNLEYDFLYLPMDFRMKNNLGYAFVNFTSVDAANVFKRNVQNYEWKRGDAGGEEIFSSKICDIAWARVQGKEALMRRFKNSNFTCDTLEFLPVVLDPPRNGWVRNPAPPVIVGRLYRS